MGQGSFSPFTGVARGAGATRAKLRGPDVAAFLTDIAHRRRLSASSQNQAMNAIVFLYCDVLGEELGENHLGAIFAVGAQRPHKVPTVLSAGEAAALIAAMRRGSMHRAMTELLFGCGLRPGVCCHAARAGLGLRAGAKSSFDRARATKTAS